MHIWTDRGRRDRRMQCHGRGDHHYRAQFVISGCGSVNPPKGTAAPPPAPVSIKRELGSRGDRAIKCSSRRVLYCPFIRDRWKPDGTSRRRGAARAIPLHPAHRDQRSHLPQRGLSPSDRETDFRRNRNRAATKSNKKDPPLGRGHPRGHNPLSTFEEGQLDCI